MKKLKDEDTTNIILVLIFIAILFIIL